MAWCLTISTAWAVDLDGDGMPDWWEAGILDAARNDSREDPDGDGLENLSEYLKGTHPLKTDTDEDGVEDAQEIQQFGSCPFLWDTDGGGRSDGEELAIGGNPLDPDDDSTNGVSSRIDLVKGWNLISFPLIPPSSAIDDVLSGISGKYTSVWTYRQDAWQGYNPLLPEFSDLQTIVPGWGYWIEMSVPAGLDAVGQAPSKTVMLRPGWNLVGYCSTTAQPVGAALASVSGYYDSIWTFEQGHWQVYDPQFPDYSDIEMLKPGRGYWINVTTACAWVLP